MAAVAVIVYEIYQSVQFAAAGHDLAENFNPWISSTIYVHSNNLFAFIVFCMGGSKRKSVLYFHIAQLRSEECFMKTHMTCAVSILCCWSWHIFYSINIFVYELHPLLKILSCTHTGYNIRISSLSLRIIDCLVSLLRLVASVQVTLKFWLIDWLI